MRHQTILLPGGVLPAELAYGALLEALAGDHVEAVAKDLEVYATDEPPPDYSLDVEVQGVLRAADAAGFERFHLVGYARYRAATRRRPRRNHNAPARPGKRPGYIAAAAHARVPPPPASTSPPRWWRWPKASSPASGSSAAMPATLRF